jgi:2',3'-cyclic-nucleotide 2'-phosphodiesterase (5'-nucleotidase family)
MNNMPLTAENPEDARILTIILPYKQGMSAAMNEVIGYSPAYLEKKKPSSALGSFMADATLAVAKEIYPSATFCVLNYGGIRSTLDSGEITVGEMFQLMPFENEIVVLKMRIAYLDTLKQFIKAKGGEPISNNIADMDSVVANENDYFYLVTNDYMANGGDDYGFLLQAEERFETGIKIRDALIAYVKKEKQLTFDYSHR